MPDWVERYYQSKRQEEAQKGGPGSGHWGHTGRPGERGGSQPGKGAGSSSATTIEQRGPKAVGSYLGSEPQFKEFKVLPKAEFDERFGNEYGGLTGDTAAVALRTGEIYIREGNEDFALHELVHAAGFMPDGVGRFLNEGMTQAATEAASRESGIPAYPSYGKERRFVDKYIIPSTGLDAQDVFRGYARAEQKGKYLADLVWEAHGDKFSNAEDWGTNTHQHLVEELSSSTLLGSSVYLMYLVDERGVGK